MHGQIKSNFDDSLYNYDEKWNGDKVSIIISAKNTIQPTDPVNWTITKVGNHMIYEDKRFTSFPKSDKNNEYSTTMMNTISLNYYLEMPGKITTSNANTVDGNKAEWHLQGDKISTTKIYAESEIPTLPFLSGFEALLALVGIIGALFIVKMRRW